MIAIYAIKQQIKRKENAFNPPGPTKLENLKSSFVENIIVKTGPILIQLNLIIN